MTETLQQKSNTSNREHSDQSQNSPEVDTLLTPSSLQSKYCFLQEIGHGSQGKIFKAKRLTDNQIVVIKQLNISSIKNWKEYELFHREANVLETLTVHGVARFYDAIDCLDDNPPCSYIIQEYIPGVSLQKMMSDGHRFRMDDVYDILIQTLDILYQLHTHEPPVIHRDIKPSNLMITTDRNGQFKVTIIDFGAVANPQVQGGGSTVAGTYGYMPPEQLMGKPVPASDIYSVAALAVQLFSGKSPAALPVKDFRLIFEPEMQDKPHALVTTLRQMLEPNLELRLCNIPDIIYSLQNYKSNHFDLVSQQNSNGYSKDYEQKLKSIRELNQNGNIDLWQQLPDFSRQIPETYLSLKSSEFIKSLNEFCVFDNSVNNNRNTNIIFFSSSFSFLILSICFLILFYNLYLFFILLPVLFLVLCLEGIILTSRKVPYHKASIPRTKKLQQLILNGRKGMATITKIEYLPQTKLEFSELYDKHLMGVNRCTECMIAAHGRPEFRVQYKFNPPDDKRIVDIYHSFITHTEPENHYQVGDPLPILYEIDDHYFEDIVTSMPYPLPLIDLDDFTTIDESNSLSILPAKIANDIKSKMSTLKQINRKKTQTDIIKSLDYKLYYDTDGPGSIDTCLTSDIVKDANQISQSLIAMILNDPNYHTVHSTCIETLISIACHRSESEQVPEALEAVFNYISSFITNKSQVGAQPGALRGTPAQGVGAYLPANSAPWGDSTTNIKTIIKDDPDEQDNNPFINHIFYQNFNTNNHNNDDECIYQFIKGMRIAQIKYHYQTNENFNVLIFNLLKLNLSNRVIEEISKLSSDFFKYLIKQLPPSTPVNHLMNYFKSAPGLLAAILNTPEFSHYHAEAAQKLTHNIIPIGDNPVNESINAIQWYLNNSTTDDKMRLTVIHELFEVMNQSSNEYSFIMDGNLLQTIHQLYENPSISDALIQELKHAPDVVILSLNPKTRHRLEQKHNGSLCSLLNTNSP